MKKIATVMYKNQKPLSVSSVVWALLVTAIVLLIAASANAQDTNVVVPEPVPISNDLIPAEPFDRGAAVLPKISEPEIAPAVPPLPEELPVAPLPTLKPLQEHKQQTMTSDQTERQANLQNARQEKKTKLEERQAMWQEELLKRRSSLEEKRQALASSTLARRSALSEMAQKRISERADKVKEILTFGIRKTKEISDRLNGKAVDLESQGVDTGIVLSNLEQVNTLLATAEQALVGIEINTEYTVTSPNPQEDWADMKSQAIAVRDLIKEAQALLRETMNSLKELAMDSQTNEPQNSNTVNGQSTN